MPKPRTRLTKAQLAKEAEKQLRDNSVTTLQAFWASINKGLQAQDPRIIKIVAEMYSYTKAPGGTTIFNQNNTANVSAGGDTVGGGKIRSIEQIIEKIEAKDANQKLLAGPVAQPEDPDIIDIDAEEVSDDDDEEED
jgi:hypothetical protein